MMMSPGVALGVERAHIAWLQCRQRRRTHANGKPAEMPRRLLLLEFNELCPVLLQKWMATGKLPNFRAFYEQSHTYITLADAEPPALEPWIQWYSIHTGLDFGQHGVFRLTDGARAAHADIWTVLQDAGFKTANFSSMNSRGTSAPGSFFLPDPWNTQTSPFPLELQRFHRFISAQVRGHTDPDRRDRASELFDFVQFALGHGLRLRTAGEIAQQLASEKLVRRDVRWRRAGILDIMQTDIFLHYFHKMKPEFATFFLNSTAHLQHAYWRYMEPERFLSGPDPDEIETYGDAILFGYQVMDRLLRDFFSLEKDGVTLAMATALSQQAFLKHEASGGQRFYRPRNLSALLELVAIRPRSLEPLMAHQYMLRFGDAREKERAIELISGVQCEGKPVFSVRTDDDTSICLSNSFNKVVSPDAKVAIGTQPGREKPFNELFYLVEETKSGCHHPEGMVWFKVGRAKHHERKVSILDIFPTILEFMEVDCSSRADRQITGQSLMADWSAVNA